MCNMMRGKVYAIMPIECISCTRHIRKENPNDQSHDNIYSQSSQLLSQEQQKLLGSRQKSKAINVPIQTQVAN